MASIKTYVKDSSIVRLMEIAIDTMASCEIVSDKMSKWSCLNGWHGQKRYNRVKSKEYRDYRLCLQYHTIDLMGEWIEPSYNYNVAIPKDLKEYFNLFIDYKISIHEKLNDIANELTIKGYNQEACKVKEVLPCLVKEIEKFRRWILDGEMCQYSYHHLKVHDDVLHCKYKEIEGE